MNSGLAAIQELGKLQNDWDTYGAEVPDQGTLARAVDCLKAVVNTLGLAYSDPNVRPIADPGVALIWRDQWRKSEVDVLVTPASTEWVVLKDRHIVEHGPLDDPQVFAVKILRPWVSI